MAGSLRPCLSNGGGCRGDDGSCFGLISSIDACKSFIRLSKVDVLDGFLPDLELCDLAGLLCELGWLGRLEADTLEEMDSEGEWYGFPMPNSSARLMAGLLLPEVPGRIRLFRGGGGRDMSGPIPADGRLNLSPFILAISLEGLRSLSGLGPGAEGVRIGASNGAFGRGNVSDRLIPPKKGSG